MPPKNSSESCRVPAAEYVRMSTEHQRYSTQNQSSAIRRYAERNGYEIVRTYCDEGRSGLTFDRRWGLRSLIADVTSRSANFNIVLVYDVSRWGRFQDMDESAYYEYECKKAGVKVEYCAEPFRNDGSLASDLQKVLKRRMAAEYSRELSEKVFVGQCRLVELGFRQGGPSGFGLRRLLIDEQNRPKTILGPREHKSIATDRVVLVPGPNEEVEIVRLIFSMFAHENRSVRQIADELNSRGVKADLGRKWHAHTVREILRNEKYIGNNVWNRMSFKLSQERVRNSREHWIRADGVFEPIVSNELFEAAQAKFRERSRPRSTKDLLEALRTLLAEHGYLSQELIDRSHGYPRAQAYTRRFGSLLTCYELVGYKPAERWDLLQSKSVIQRRNVWVAAMALERLRELGASVTYNNRSRLFLIEDKIIATLALGLPARKANQNGAHIIHINPKRVADIVIVACLTKDQSAVESYYLLPYAIDHRSRVIVHADGRFWLDKCRLESAEQLTDFAR